MKRPVILCFLFFVIGCNESLELGPRSPSSSSGAKQLQEQSASDLGLPVRKIVELDSKTRMEFILIPAGEFNMGSPKTELKRAPDEGPVHHVKISKPFYMGKYEVTQAQYKAIMGKLTKKCKFESDYLPVENVNWNNANICLRELSIKKRMNFRLPTEAEWEYACKAGTSTPFYTGETINAKQANYDSRYVYDNGVAGGYMGFTTPVGSFPPNAFGLYDMHGNVWEWCSDFYDKDYYKHSKAVDPKGPASGRTRVIRGGSWNHNPNKLRSADRNRRMYGADKRYLGFRIVLDIPDSPHINEKDYSFIPPTEKPGTKETSSEVQSSQYYNSSIIAYAPLDKSDLKGEFLSIVEVIRTSGVFDSVKVFHEGSYLNHAKIYGYRYVLVSNADRSYTLHDLLLEKDEIIQFSGDNSNFVFTIKQTVSKFEKRRSSNNLAKKYMPIEEELVYDEATQRGYISVKGKGLNARSWMLKKIGEVCSSKNIVIQAGVRPEPGYFRVLDEKLKDGKFTIEFETIR